MKESGPTEFTLTQTPLNGKHPKAPLARHLAALPAEDGSFYMDGITKTRYREIAKGTSADAVVLFVISHFRSFVFIHRESRNRHYISTSGSSIAAG
jgi:hypothetical protein